ncbi:peptidoglycan-N-acetylmuramic acid deacetylase [Clostridium saccharoperbutylacetonicum]|uniref:Putative xylanase/chitin deacetylase n=1 Tax=Clostridium saccharoperbutylacetonicum N1-4(HMT) TaxID=931276 RepID=M1MM69_9CLOT|nr:polysaccharide deacetylase family protein [Clostridium saccharoperbutylacetonicum]AGF57313.1 putative xylanase/chitin deacetylase [Clostridium saccharoperbutylacetonicum N1-4(HMT)]NRT61924.1 peptidoglycan-N-acetylmuramic acid deacetylase [Clostridium saccharoperbutylacetonicum]NSB25253.1 peptidoglycan-N-acetylmuramic acid deacetylase [Clostridium saccharoperbutylacetonicum]NSB44622.1 peptidoglycan-N-acetylmuramic acid deacetylase [Clostridium saccharoperbutylacetonicum]
MIKRNLIITMSLSLMLLSGCQMSNGNSEKNEADKKIVSSEDKQEAKSDDDIEANSGKEKKVEAGNVNGADKSDNKKLAESQNSEALSEEKSITPKIVADTSSLSTKAIPWSWLYSPRDNASLLEKYKGYAFGDTSKKIIYLTFDEGYENGYTSRILDVLKANNVHATFFVTKPYVTGSFNGVQDSVLIKRMINEGHIIGNHSVQHKSMPSFKSESAFNAELTGVEQAVNSIPGCKMSKYFRPPEGTFSELSLYYTQKLGYKSIFFAFAYQDYDVDNQPSPESAKATILKNTRNGMICLLHAVSKTNTEILDSLIKEWKSRGYEFKSLNELPN